MVLILPAMIYPTEKQLNLAVMQIDFYFSHINLSEKMVKYEDACVTC